MKKTSICLLFLMLFFACMTVSTHISYADDGSSSFTPIGSSDFSISISISPYTPGKIEPSEITPIPELNISFGEYHVGQIENQDVEPIEPIDINISEYVVPNITGLVPEAIEPFYIEMTEYLTDDELGRLAALPEIEIAEIVQRQYNIISDLKTAFSLSGIHIEFDSVSGMARIDSSLLYAVDKYEVTEKGKEVLRKVMQIYYSVLSKEEYRDYISDIVIIGHTDNDGDYDYNKRLSERRANAVKDFCLSEECGLEDTQWLASLLKAEGHSYDELIYKSDGKVDKPASRRVEIGFHVILE